MVLIAATAVIAVEQNRARDHLSVEQGYSLHSASQKVFAASYYSYIHILNFSQGMRPLPSHVLWYNLLLLLEIYAITLYFPALMRKNGDRKVTFWSISTSYPSPTTSHLSGGTLLQPVPASARTHVSQRITLKHVNTMTHSGHRHPVLSQPRNKSTIQVWLATKHGICSNSIHRNGSSG